jgi:hypothetical protein
MEDPQPLRFCAFAGNSFMTLIQLGKNAGSRKDAKTEREELRSSFSSLNSYK